MNIPHKWAPNVKAKDLVGIPWMVAFALRDDGWWLRTEIIWHKPNPMPESVTDRPTRSHEYVFLLSKGPRYFYDAKAIMEPVSSDTHARTRKDRAKAEHKSAPTDKVNGLRAAGVNPKANHDGRNGSKQNASFSAAVVDLVTTRNKRTVWTVPTQPYPEAHFATFPEDLIKPCILAGCPVGGTAVDPFGGSGTVGKVAIELGRKAIVIDLNPDYIEMAKRRCNVTPGLAL
jgi:DNA modification methylase